MFSPHLSSSNSPHRYEEDRFEAEQLSRHLPKPAPRDYELTFKKHQDNSYFRQPSNHQSLLQTVSKHVDFYFRCDLEQLSSLPFAELYQLQLSPLIQYKLKLIGELLEVKRTRSKIASIDVNLRCLKTKQSLSSEDKNRIFLLDLLWQQLTKKIFVEALKLNVTHQRYLRIQQQDNDMSKEAIRIQPHQISEQFDQQQEKDEGEESNHLWEHKSDDSSEQEHHLSGKLIILNQIVSSIIKRILFSSFNTLKHHNKNHFFPSQMNLQQQEEQQEQSQQWNHNDEQNFRKYDHEEGRGEESLTENRLEQLYSYIEELHEECAETNSILKKYFIKWKIYLLEGVAESIARQISDYREDPTPRTQVQRQKMIHHLEADSLSGQIQSRIITESSQGVSSSLRHEKSLLKDLIRRKSACKFLNNLRDYKQLQQINSVCLSMRKEYIVNRVFKFFKQLWQDGKVMKEMEDYYEDMSESQYEDDGTSKLFHKTNLLYRYFRALVNLRRDQKMARILEHSQMKLCLRIIYKFALRQKRIFQTIDRREISVARRLIFRYFRLWKQTHQFEQPYLQKLKHYLAGKQKAKLRLYFSSFKYAYKQGILSQKLAEKYYKQRKQQQIIKEWSYLTLEGQQFRQKQALVRQYRRQNQGYFVLKRLREFYMDILDYQRLGVKQQKLRRMLLRIQVLKGIKKWRQNHLRKKTYQTIQLKLTRLTQKQRKRQILHEWLDRARNKSKDNSLQSQKHKNWLVNYYGSLCSAQPR